MDYFSKIVLSIETWEFGFGHWGTLVKLEPDMRMMKEWKQH